MLRCHLPGLMLAAAVACPVAAHAGDAIPRDELRLTLPGAVALARENNPGLRQAANQVEASRITVARRRADFAPDLTATLAGSERFDKAVSAAGARDGRNHESVSGTLASSLNLFNGFGDVAALRGAEWSLAGERDSYSRQEQTLVFSTMTAFLQALSDRDLIRVRAENLEGNRRQLEQVAALYLAGNRPVSDLYQQQAETAGAELDLLTAERDADISLQQLFKTIGLSPAAAAFMSAPDLGGVEALLAAQDPAADNARPAVRADLRARAKQVEAAREETAAAAAGYWPTLSLTATLSSGYSSLDRSAGFADQFGDHNPAAAIGLTLSVPVFDRWQTRHQVAQARLRQDDARLSLLQQQLQAESEFGRALRDFRTAQKLIVVAEARLTAARQALAAMEERYRVGAATLVELTRARAQYTEAAYKRVEARYGLITQGVSVAYYQGDGARLQALLAQWENAQ